MDEATASPPSAGLSPPSAGVGSSISIFVYLRLIALLTLPPVVRTARLDLVAVPRTALTLTGVLLRLKPTIPTHLLLVTLPIFILLIVRNCLRSIGERFLRLS